MAWPTDHPKQTPGGWVFTPPLKGSRGVAATPMRIGGGQASPNLHREHWGWSWPPPKGLAGPLQGTPGVVRPPPGFAAGGQPATDLRSNSLIFFLLFFF